MNTALPRGVFANSSTSSVISLISPGSDSGGGLPKSSGFVTGCGRENPNHSRKPDLVGGAASGAGAARALFARGIAASKHLSRSAASAISAHFAISASASRVASARAGPADSAPANARTKETRFGRMRNSR